MLDSSNFAEDNENETAAGKFESVLKVKLNKNDIKKAVNNVVFYIWGKIAVMMNNYWFKDVWIILIIQRLRLAEIFKLMGHI